MSPRLGLRTVAAGIVGLIGAIVFPAAQTKPLFVALLVQIVIVGIYSYSIAHSRVVP